MTPRTDILTTARAEALFSSALATGSVPSPAEVATAIRDAVRARQGVRGCVAALAGEYGDHPEIAMLRMRWALSVVRATYAGRARALAASAD